MTALGWRSSVALLVSFFVVFVPPHFCIAGCTNDVGASSATPFTALANDVPLGFAKVSNRVGAGMAKDTWAFFDRAFGNELVWGLVLHYELHAGVIEFILHGFEALGAEAAAVLSPSPAWHKTLSSAVVGDIISVYVFAFSDRGSLESRCYGANPLNKYIHIE